MVRWHLLHKLSACSAFKVVRMTLNKDKCLVRILNYFLKALAFRWNFKSFYMRTSGTLKYKKFKNRTKLVIPLPEICTHRSILKILQGFSNNSWNELHRVKLFVTWRDTLCSGNTSIPFFNFYLLYLTLNYAAENRHLWLPTQNMSLQLSFLYPEYNLFLLNSGFLFLEGLCIIFTYNVTWYLDTKH